MAHKLISSGSPFEKEAGYSRALIDDRYVFVSGTTGYDYQTMELPADFETQARNTLATIASTLEDAGSAITQVVRVTYMITDRKNASTMMRIAGEVFAEVRPAATLIVCGLLREDMLVEIEVTAALSVAQG